VELRILDVFWGRGPSTVREVHNAILKTPDRSATAYSTTLKMIQVLHSKGMLDRDESVRPQVYQAKISREDAQQHYIRDVAKRLFGGAMSEIVQCAISSGDVTEAELSEMQRLIREAKKEAKQK